MGRYESLHALALIFAMAFCAERTVLFMSIATVMGPTPPGTGVMTDATCGGGEVVMRS